MQSWNVKVQYIYIIHHYAYIYICLNVSHVTSCTDPPASRVGGSTTRIQHIQQKVVYGFKIHSAKPM